MAMSVVNHCVELIASIVGEQPRLPRQRVILKEAIACAQPIFVLIIAIDHLRTIRCLRIGHNVSVGIESKHTLILYRTPYDAILTWTDRRHIGTNVSLLSSKAP